MYYCIFSTLESYLPHFFYNFANLTKGSSGLGSDSKEQIDNNTLSIVKATKLLLKYPNKYHLLNCYNDIFSNKIYL